MNMTGIFEAPDDRTVTVNEDALSAWYEKEWERQIRLAEEGVLAFNVIRGAKVHSVVPDEVSQIVRQKIGEINNLLSVYGNLTVSFPEIVTMEALNSASKIVSGMDDWEKAAYDRDSMAIIMGEMFGRLAKPTPFTMLSFAITNHMWQKFGAKSTYQKWANPIRDYGNMCSDLDKIKGAIYRHLLVMLTLRYRGTDPFTNEPITPPAEFYTVE